MTSNNARFAKTLVLAAMMGLTAGCASLVESDGRPAPSDSVSRSADRSTSEADRLLERQIRQEERSVIEIMDNRFYADRRAQFRETGEWLSDIPFDMPLDARTRSVSLGDILKVFAASGVHISSTVPVEDYHYSGFAVRNTDARTALQVILSSAGVDYKIDDDNQTVRIVPMPRKTYNLSINNRIAEYTNETEGSSASDNTGRASSSITSTNAFWESLESEIEQRCTILVPVKRGPRGGEQMAGDPMAASGSDQALIQGLQQGGGNPSGAAADFDSDSTMFNAIETCVYSVNPNTGTITVQGPSWIQEDLDEYFDRVNLAMNTRITLRTRIVLVKNEGSQSAGMDFSGFLETGAGQGLALQNNALGGVTLSQSGGLPSISAAGSSARNFLGFGGNTVQAFLGWLENYGEVTTEMEPTITTVSGVPTTFERVSPVVYYRYNQQSTSGDSTSSVSITSEEVERTVGSTIRVNPTYDIDRRVVRTQIGIDQRYLTGWQDEVNYLATGDDIQTVPVRVPLIEQINMNGELLLRDGETVVVGGQKFQSSEMSERGVRRLRDSRFFGGLFGSSRSEMETFTYYAIMTVHIDEEPNARQER